MKFSLAVAFALAAAVMAAPAPTPASADCAGIIVAKDDGTTECIVFNEEFAPAGTVVAEAVILAGSQAARSKVRRNRFVPGIRKDLQF